MDTSTEEDVRFVRNISEAIRDLDAVLAQEKTSSSSQSSSAQPSPSQVTSRDLKPEPLILSSQDQKFTLDFRLGQAAAPSSLRLVCDCHWKVFLLMEIFITSTNLALTFQSQYWSTAFSRAGKPESVPTQA